MKRNHTATTAETADQTTNDMDKIKIVARQLQGEGWAVAMLGHSYTREARAAVAKIPMRIGAAERQEFYLAIIPADAGAFKRGHLARPLCIGLRGDGAYVAQLLANAGLTAQYTGDDGDGAIVVLPAATEVEARYTRLQLAADQAISNLRVITSLNDQPHIDQIADETADLLGAALGLVDTTPRNASDPWPVSAPAEHGPACDAVSSDHPAVAHFDAYVEQKQAEAAAAQPKRAGRPKKTLVAQVEESDETPAAQPATPDAPAAAKEKRPRGRPKAVAAEVPPAAA